MIIVLKNADFSGKNIGHIDFNTPLSAETLALMAYATKFPTDYENENAQALNRFINTIKTAGVYSKLSVLVVPCMSSTIDECAVNQLTGSNCLSPTIFKSLFELRNGNLHRTNYAWEDKTDQFGYTIAHSYDNFSMFCSYKSGETKLDDIMTASVSGWQNPSCFIRWANAGYATFNCGRSGINLSGQSTALVQVGLTSSPFVINFGEGVASLRYAEMLFDGVYSTPPSVTGQLIKLNPLIWTGSSVASNGELLIYGCGTKLTDDEMKTLYDAIKEFSAHFV